MAEGTARREERNSRIPDLAGMECWLDCPQMATGRIQGRQASRQLGWKGLVPSAPSQGEQRPWEVGIRQTLECRALYRALAGERPEESVGPVVARRNLQTGWHLCQVWWVLTSMRVRRRFQSQAPFGMVLGGQMERAPLEPLGQTANSPLAEAELGKGLLPVWARRERHPTKGGSIADGMQEQGMGAGLQV